MIVISFKLRILFYKFYITKQNPIGVPVYLLIPILIDFISPHYENKL